MYICQQSTTNAPIWRSTAASTSASTPWAGTSVNAGLGLNSIQMRRDAKVSRAN